MKYNIFIAYESTTGMCYAENLRKALEKRKGYNHKVFLADVTLVAGDPWEEERDSALNSCKYFIVVITALTLDSDWVTDECKKVEGKKRIIPCRDSNMPLSDTGYLANMHQIDFVDKSNLAHKVILELKKIERKEKEINVENDTEEFLKRGKLLQSLRKFKDAEEEYKKAVKKSLTFPKDYYDRITARRIFFSFHYERDAWRVNQVRNNWLTKPDRETAGFWDTAAWEEVKKKGAETIKHWINKQLEGTSVTVVLIGAETASGKWVQYEIKKSVEKGNGLLGVYIHNLKDQEGKADHCGSNPFEKIYTERNGHKVCLSEIYPTYDWVDDEGYKNFANWVENAAQKAVN